MLDAEREGSVLRLFLNRPEARNAFDEGLIAALHDAFSTLDPGVRAVVIAGRGPAFCAGGDLNWMRRTAGYAREENVAEARKLQAMLEAARDCPALTVVRVHGACFGGACGLVAACDVAVARDDARFCFSEARLGLVPAVISPIVVPKIGPGHARALFATASVFDAARAERIGLVHAVQDAEGLDPAVDAVVRDVLLCAPGAVAAAKRVALELPDDPAGLLADRRASDEGREGVAAFLDKRKASWVAG